MGGKPVGIDLGTYNSAVAYKGPDGKLHMAVSEDGPTSQGNVFPSFVKFNALGKPMAYGETARREIPAPTQVVWGVKRLIGKGYSQVKPELGTFLYRIEPGKEGMLLPQGQEKYTPTQISGFVLAWIKDNIENRTLNPLVGRPIDKAVITHPAYFDTVEIGETRKAAEKAGFADVRLISEPVASALSYGLHFDVNKKPYLMVVDWGAGTLDIVIVRLMLDSERDIPLIAEANPAHGNLHLGGIDMDNAIIDWVIRSQKLDELGNLMNLLRKGLPMERIDEDTLAVLRSAMKLREEAQEAKIDLSTNESTTRSFPFKGKAYVFTLTRKQLEKELVPTCISQRKNV